jgi:UDPglucose 6-dehydrogenase
MKKIFPNINYHESWEEAVTNCNAVIIMTEWNEFRSISLKKLGSLLKNKNLLDTRNIFKTEQLEKSGFKFKTIGMGSN